MHKIFIIRANQRHFGGAEIYLERLCMELEQHNILHEIIHSKIPKWLASGIRAWLFNQYICLNKPQGAFYFSLDRISCADVLRVGDGVHKHYMNLRGGYRFIDAIYTNIEKRGFEHAKHLIAISNMVKRNIIDCYGIAEDKISVIYNGIPLHDTASRAKHHESAKRLRLELKLLDAPVILYVGSGYKRKGVWELLELFSRLQSDAWLLIVGKERHMQRYKNKAKELKISHKVLFLGPRHDIWDLYALASVFVFPTHYEPFGNVILEAMHSHCAVITTKQCGGGELLEPTWLMDGPTDYSIAPLLDNLLADSSLLARIQEQNYQRSCEFSIQHNALQTLEILKRFM